MLQKKARLPGFRVRYVFLKGKFFAHKFFTIRFLPTHNTLSRFAVIVSIKVEKKAVKRNKIRRQCYEIIRLNQHLLDSHYDIILKVKPHIQEIDHKLLQEYIISFFHYLNKLKK